MASNRLLIQHMILSVGSRLDPTLSIVTFQKIEPTGWFATFLS